MGAVALAEEDEAVASEEGLADGRSAYMSIVSFVPALSSTIFHRHALLLLCSVGTLSARDACDQGARRPRR